VAAGFSQFAKNIPKPFLMYMCLQEDREPHSFGSVCGYLKEREIYPLTIRAVPNLVYVKLTMNCTLGLCLTGLSMYSVNEHAQNNTGFYYRKIQRSM